MKVFEGISALASNGSNKKIKKKYYNRGVFRILIFWVPSVNKIFIQHPTISYSTKIARVAPVLNTKISIFAKGMKLNFEGVFKFNYNKYVQNYIYLVWSVVQMEICDKSHFRGRIFPKTSQPQVQWQFSSRERRCLPSSR